MNRKWNWLVALSMLLGLVFTTPMQTVSAEASAAAEFTFVSSANPSNYGQEVTFTLSATGSDPTYPPLGYVDFLDNGMAVPGCTMVQLNMSNGGPAAGIPASCTTSSLTIGTHTITAVFSSLMPDYYADNTISLPGDQTVIDSILLTINPSTLPDVSLSTYFQLLLIARYPGGSECTNCLWLTEGNLPEGIGLNAETGELRGTPTLLGTYNFTVVVEDGNGARGSQAFTWNVTLVKPIVDVGTSTTYVSATSPTTLGATARHPNPYYSPQPTGKMSFAVNGVPVPGCSGTEALSTNMWGQAYCTSYLPTGLTAGSYQIQAEFTPDATSSGLYLTGTGTGTLQVNPPQAVVSGRVFLDNNQNGVKDETEAAQGVWHVYLNQDCDDFLEGNVDSVSETGAFSFYPVPITDHTYCLFVDLSGNEGYVQTTPYNNLTLSGDQYFEIGVYYPHLTILPNSEEYLRGKVGTYFEQTFEVSGGTQPYTTDVTSNALYPLQDGLSFNAATRTLSGTPTAGGVAEIHLSVVDSAGLTAEMTYRVVIQALGEFYLESSANPSALDQAVTFTLSGFGSVADPQFGLVPPYGIVSFYDGDMLITGCEQKVLNANLDTFQIGQYPAACTTTLTEGQHTITAFFSLPDGLYADAAVTLTQQVGVSSSLSISPEMLPDAAFQTSYIQQLSASGGTEPYVFSLVGGTLPDGLLLSSGGLLSGFPDGLIGSMLIGTYPITIQVQDATGAITHRNYDFVLGKATPTVTVHTSSSIYWGDRFAVSAEVVQETPYSFKYIPDGTIAFFVDDIPVQGCQAVSYIGNYLCENISMDLSVGTHSVTAIYTPTAWHEPYYFSAAGSSEFSVESRNLAIQGSLFDDVNQNGTYDAEENKLMEDGWVVNLDQDCDGGIDYTTTTIWGSFVFYDIPVSGECHRITLTGEPGYQQTTLLADFIPSIYTFISVGFYYPKIALSPSEYNLPSGMLGVDYNLSVSANGGTEPYIYTIESGELPAGLSFSTEGVLSGIPTVVGDFNFRIQAKDANQAIGSKYYSLSIKTNGIFTFTSSSNPSIQGEQVTFTISATGNAATSNGVYPPLGSVTFYADGTPIDGCSDLYLNISPDWIISDYPVTCTTAALQIGTHAITATYTDWMGYYNQPSLSLTQEVSTAVFADLSITNVDRPDPVKAGTKLLYMLTVSNLGPEPAQNVIVTDKLDLKTTYVSVSAPKGWTCTYAASSGTVTCTSASLASGSSAIIKVSVVVSKTARVGKEVVNNASVSSATFDPNLSNNAAAQKTLVVK